jgi:hypothetical protein
MTQAQWDAYVVDVVLQWRKRPFRDKAAVRTPGSRRPTWRGEERDVKTNQPFNEAKAAARFQNALTEFEAALCGTPIRLLGLEPKQIGELLDRLDHLFSSKAPWRRPGGGAEGDEAVSKRKED